MSAFFEITLGGAIAFILYTYAGYPLMVWLMGQGRPPRVSATGFSEWPSITITLVAYNEARSLPGALDALLDLDYPEDRRQVLVVSDGSSDGTDSIVGQYRHRGVELLRINNRRGKTAAENEALPHIRGAIVVNTDASTRIHRKALRPLIAAFADPTVGVASGRDVSVSRLDDRVNVAESKYVGFEMWLRSMENRIGGIVGASGCFYAIRSHIHACVLPVDLSRDFAAVLNARQQGYRSVMVREALCSVPRTTSLRHEYRRKVRTITRGIQTLLHKVALLNPGRYGLFAWMLFSHKLCRWLVPWVLVLALIAMSIASVSDTMGRWALAGMLVGIGAAGLGWFWRDELDVPRALAVPAYLMASNLAVMHAWIRIIRRDRNPIWEPTRRDTAKEPPDEMGTR